MTTRRRPSLHPLVVLTMVAALPAVLLFADLLGDFDQDDFDDE